MLKQERTKNIILGILLIALSFELIRSCFRAGDFIGYINAGNLTLSGQNIYSDYLNTWPPFFSVFSVPLTLVDHIHPALIRTPWLILSALTFFWTMRICTRWLYHKELLPPYKKGNDKAIMFSNFLVFVPFIIMTRFILDNFANVQINILLLWSSILVIDWYIKGKYSRAGILLALIISIKVYPVFLLLYFIFKREHSIVVWSILFLIFFNLIPFLVYGQETAIGYYSHWWNEIASPYASVQHKNQSFFSMLRSLFRHESPGLGIYINLFDISLERLKKLAYGIIILGALYPMYLFRNKLENKGSEFALLEYGFVLTAIPILSPLAWKAYFIYLWPAYLLVYYYLYADPLKLTEKKKNTLKVFYILSIFLNVFSTDLFVGPYISDLLECFSCITIGTLILMVLLLVFYVQLKEDHKKQFHQ